MPHYLILLALGVGPPLAAAFGGLTTWGWIGLGAAAWVGAILIKVMPGGLVAHATARVVSNPKARAAVWGCWSGVCELGASAVVFFLSDPLPVLADVVGFGLGAGSIEILVLTMGSAPTVGRGVPAASAPGRLLEWSGVIERGLTSVGHVATRGLVWAGMQRWALAPAILLAIGTFTAVDGVAVYGKRAGWNWHDPALLARFLRFLAIVTSVEVLGLATCALCL